jgi:hypothetical protein
MIEAKDFNLAHVIEDKNMHLQARADFIFQNITHLGDRYSVRIKKVIKKVKSNTIKTYEHGKIVYRKQGGGR